MPSLSFDPVAHVYDDTRGYPPAVAQQIAYAIVETTGATPRTRLLEVGVGTGRIAFPVASSGHNYTGVDISEKMIERLEAKWLNNSWQELVQAWGTLPDEDVTKASQVRRFTRVEPAASMRLLL